MPPEKTPPYTKGSQVSKTIDQDKDSPVIAIARKLKQENTASRTYLVFIDKFLANYEILNNYNKKILDTLINNQEILIKNSQVVIPNTGWDLLKELKILYTEEEWKKYNQ